MSDTNDSNEGNERMHDNKINSYGNERVIRICTEQRGCQTSYAYKVTDHNTQKSLLGRNSLPGTRDTSGQASGMRPGHSSNHLRRRKKQETQTACVRGKNVERGRFPAMKLLEKEKDRKKKKKKKERKQKDESAIGKAETSTGREGRYEK